MFVAFFIHWSGEATARAWTGQARQSSTLPRMPSRTPSKILVAQPQAEKLTLSQVFHQSAV